MRTRVRELGSSAGGWHHQRLLVQLRLGVACVVREGRNMAGCHAWLAGRGTSGLMCGESTPKPSLPHRGRSPRKERNPKPLRCPRTQGT